MGLERKYSIFKWLSFIFLTLFAPLSIAASIALGIGEVVTTGDYDGDGLSDIATGAVNTSPVGSGGVKFDGVVGILYGGALGAGLQYHAGPVTGQGGQTATAYGTNLATGNFDNDAYDDLAVIAYNLLVVTEGGNSGIQANSADFVFELDDLGIDGTGLGSAMTVGDFDGDGYDDLAVNLEHRFDIGLTTAGSVFAFYGGSSGLGSGGFQIWSQNRPNIPGSSELGDNFGAALGAGDFNNDGFDDLAIGVPGEDLISNTEEDAGAVNIIYGGINGLDGLNGPGAQLFSQAGAVNGAVEAGDRFGSAIAVGRFNGGNYDDIAIGVPGEAIGTVFDAGAVNVLFGSSNGITATGDQLWHRGSTGVGGSLVTSAEFGNSLVAGDLNNDGLDELVIGAPGLAVFDLGGPGSLTVLNGSLSGLVSPNSQYIDQNSPGIADVAEEGDQFAKSLAIGDFNGDGDADLVVGVPGEETSATNAPGVLQLFVGAGAGVSTNDVIVTPLLIP